MIMKLIDKSALVAEIERLKTIYDDDENIRYVAKYNILIDILSFINTLEVKEVEEPNASDRGTAEEIIINLKRVEHDYRIDLTKEIEWVRNQVKKGSKGMTEIKAGKCYMCLREIKGYESFTKGKVYSSLYDNALINDNHIEVLVMPCENFRIATEQEIKAQKGKDYDNRRREKRTGYS